MMQTNTDKLRTFKAKDSEAVRYDRKRDKDRPKDQRRNERNRKMKARDKEIEE